MNLLESTGIIWVGSICAGFVGALTGLGGGVFIVPLLTLVLGVDIKYAIGASLISVIATSSGAATAYIKRGFTNLRAAMFLCTATTMGALLGAFLALQIETVWLSVIFGVLLFFIALTSFKKISGDEEVDRADPIATYLKLDSSYISSKGEVSYHVHSVPLGLFFMLIAGILSGLLGIGSGSLKVLAMDHFMKIPFKVSTATSNLMIGVTAAASSGLYLSRGYIDPVIAMPVMLGVLVGAFVGSKMMQGISSAFLRKLFGLVVIFIAIQMVYNGLEKIL